MRIDVQAVARELHPAICALDVLHTNLTDNKLALLFAELTAAYWQLDPLFFWFWKAGATSAAKQHLPDLIRLYSCYGARNTAMEPEWPPEKFAPFSKGVVNPVFRNFMAEALMHSGHVALFLTAFPGTIFLSATFCASSLS